MKKKSGRMHRRLFEEKDLFKQGLLFHSVHRTREVTAEI
jgi:hypothetical protein